MLFIFLKQFKQLWDRKQLLIDFLCELACFVKDLFVIEVLWTCLLSKGSFFNGNVLKFVEKSRRHDKGEKKSNNQCYYVIWSACGYEPKYAPWYSKLELVGLTRVKFFFATLGFLKKESSKEQPLLRCNVEEIVPLPPFLFLPKWLCSCRSARVEG